MGLRTRDGGGIRRDRGWEGRLEGGEEELGDDGGGEGAGEDRDVFGSGRGAEEGGGTEDRAGGEEEGCGAEMEEDGPSTGFDGCKHCEVCEPLRSPWELVTGWREGGKEEEARMPDGENEGRWRLYGVESGIFVLEASVSSLWRFARPCSLLVRIYIRFIAPVIR